MVNEGRKNIRMGTKKFKKLTDEENILSDLYHFFNNKDIYEDLLNKLEVISEKSKKNFVIKNKPEIFKKNYYEYKRSIHSENLIKKISNYLYIKFLKKFNFFKNSLYLEMNYSFAFKGYGLKTHTDKNSRLVVFLLYLNELNNDGGHLEMYSKNSYTNEKFKLEKKFKPEGGKLIVFLSNPESFHNVSKIEKSETERYFCYGGYTSLNQINWMQHN